MVWVWDCKQSVTTYSCVPPHLQQLWLSFLHVRRILHNGTFFLHLLFFLIQDFAGLFVLCLLQTSRDIKKDWVHLQVQWRGEGRGEGRGNMWSCSELVRWQGKTLSQR